MLTFPCQSRAIVKHRPRDVRLGFTLGAVRRRDCGGPLLSTWATKLPRLTRLLANFGQLMCKLNTDSSFNFTAIQVNKNNETALHVDCNNVGPSRIVGLGEYTRGRHGAGDFWVQGVPENSPGQSHSTQKTWIEFDGNVPHGTLWEPRPDETRYTLVYYTHKVCLQRDPSRLLQTLRDEYHYCVDVEKLKLQQAPDPDLFPVAWGPRSSGKYPSRQVRVDSAREAFKLAGGKVADPVNYGEDSGPDSESDEESRDPERPPPPSPVPPPLSPVPRPPSPDAWVDLQSWLRGIPDLANADHICAQLKSEEITLPILCDFWSHLRPIPSPAALKTQLNVLCPTLNLLGKDYILLSKALEQSTSLPS